MDILFLINKMRELHKYFRFTHYEQLLFYEILLLNSSQESKNSVLCSNEYLCSTLNIEQKTLRRARNKLIKANLIEYKSGRSKREIGQYNIVKSPTNTPPKVPTNMPTLFSLSGTGLPDVPLPNKTPKTPTIPPTLDEVNSYCLERKNGIEPQLFIDFYTSKEWMIGKNKMKDWKAAIRTWELTRKKNENKSDFTQPKDYSKRF